MQVLCNVTQQDKERDRGRAQSETEKTHLRIHVLVGGLVQVEQRLVDLLLESQGLLHGVEAGAPLVAGWLGDGLEHDAAAALVLELHEPLRVLHLLRGALLEVLGEVGQRHVVAVKVGGLSEGRGGGGGVGWGVVRNAERDIYNYAQAHKPT